MNEPKNTASLASKVIETAYEWNGEKEIPGNQGFFSKLFTAFILLSGWKKGWMWCTSFAKSVLMAAYEEYIVAKKQFNPFYDDAEARATVKKFLKCYSPNAQRWRKNLIKAGYQLLDKPVIGALGFLGYDPVHGHIFIVYNVMGLSNYMSIDGNSKDSVQIVSRTTKDKHSLGFVAPPEV